MTKIDQIIRTKRKSIALIVQRDGRLVVRAPIDATDEQILTVVQRKNGWIHSKQEAVLSTYPQVVEKEFVNGEGYWYLGTSYRLRIVDNAGHPLELDTYFLLDRSVLPRAREVFTAWFAGFVPGDRPLFTVVVAVHHPKGEVHGSQVAAPIFRELAAGLLAYRGVPPMLEGG